MYKFAYIIIILFTYIHAPYCIWNNNLLWNNLQFCFGFGGCPCALQVTNEDFHQNSAIHRSFRQLGKKEKWKCDVSLEVCHNIIVSKVHSHSKKSEMNVELCVILWLPRIKNKHNDIMGNHFILQNSTPPAPLSQGWLIRKRNSLWYQCKVQPYWLASIIMWENALTLGHYTLGTKGAWWGLGCDAQALASITMISMQKKR